MAKFKVYTCCRICKIYEVSEESTEDCPNFRNRHGALMSYRCFKGHMSFATDKIEDVPKDYRPVTDEDAKAWETPPRPLTESEFWCRECRAVHTKTQEVLDKIAAGKWLRIVCPCGNKIYLDKDNNG